jgi:phosphoglycerate dehydrogenase-like enzyme
MQPRIVFVSAFPDAVTAAREMLPAGFELVTAEAKSAAYWEALAEAEYLAGFVDALVDDALFGAAPRLRLIQLLSAGYDRADIDAARRAGVPIANNGGANATAVAEHAIMLMLATSRQLVRQHANVAGGRWRGNAIPRLHELKGKVLGIVGFGTIGKKTARLATAFGMTVVYYDIARLSDHGEDLHGARFRLLHELLRDADIVSLHVPLNPTTRRMIGAAELALMKPSAIVINTSRGPVIDETALHAALGSDAIAGAGLDVFDTEPPRADNPLFALDNVTLTGHLAGPTWEANATRLRNAFDNVQRVARGAPPLWVIPELA